MAHPHTLLTSLVFGESPRWHEGRLWVADWGTQALLAVDPDGQDEVMLRMASSRRAKGASCAGSPTARW